MYIVLGFKIVMMEHLRNVSLTILRPVVKQNAKIHRPPVKLMRTLKKGMSNDQCSN